jgi:hypothetical protein
MHSKTIKTKDFWEKFFLRFQFLRFSRFQNTLTQEICYADKR